MADRWLDAAGIYLGALLVGGLVFGAPSPWRIAAAVLLWAVTAATVVEAHVWLICGRRRGVTAGTCVLLGGPALTRRRERDEFWLAPWRLYRLPSGRAQWLRIEEVWPGSTWSVVHGPLIHPTLRPQSPQTEPHDFT